MSLFDRTSRMVRPTDVGEIFLAGAARLIGDFDHLVQDISNIAEARRGHVVVACLSSIAGRLMPAVIQECERRYPALELTIRDEINTRLLDLVRIGEADLGLTAQWQGEQEELDFTPLFFDAYHVVLGKGHTLTRRKSVAWSELNGETLVSLNASASSHASIEQQLVRSHVRPRRSIAVGHLATVNGMLEAGLGISILPRLALPVAGHPTLVHRPMARPGLGRTIGLVMRKNRSASPAASGFCEVLQELVGLMKLNRRPPAS
jgi:DNA-binding transcriptional LysR family regulator